MEYFTKKQIMESILNVPQDNMEVNGLNTTQEINYPELAKGEKYSLIQKYCKEGVGDINQKDMNNCTCLFYLLKSKHRQDLMCQDAVQQLIMSKRLDVNQKMDWDGNTVLSFLITMFFSSQNMRYYKYLSDVIQIYGQQINYKINVRNAGYLECIQKCPTNNGTAILQYKDKLLKFFKKKGAENPNAPAYEKQPQQSALLKSAVGKLTQFLRNKYGNSAEYWLSNIVTRKFQGYGNIQNDPYLFIDYVNNVISGKVNIEESRKVLVTTEQCKILQEMTEDMREEMTEFAFKSNVRAFLKSLIGNPLEAKPSLKLISKGLTKNKLLYHLINANVLQKEEKIKDTDENGNRVSPTMSVKYKIPKENFDRKLRKLYIKLFDNNDTKEVDECTDAGSVGGSFVQPVFKEIVSRKSKD